MSDPSIEGEFARDRDAILRCRSFRLLAGKTQVVAAPADPLVRNRLTHTLEVSAIARAIGRPLGLREDLIEAIALGHDLGHPAFGHAGEHALASLVPGGFHHAAHSVRVVSVLEPDLRLSPAVVDGIFKHSKGRSGAIFARAPSLRSCTREALVVRAADLYAYACHDLDDAYLLEELAPHELPPRVASLFGDTASNIAARLIRRTVEASWARGEVSLDEEGQAALEELRAFLYQRLYEGPRLTEQSRLIHGIVAHLWEASCSRRPQWDEAIGRVRARRPPRSEPSDPASEFIDLFASLTDRQALELHLRLKNRSAPSRASSEESRGCALEAVPSA